MTEDILQEAYLAGDLTVNRYIMRKLGVNAALLYAALLEQYDSVKNGKDVTLRTVFKELQNDAHLSVPDLLHAAAVLESMGVIDKNGDQVNVCVVEEGQC